MPSALQVVLGMDEAHDAREERTAVGAQPRPPQAAPVKCEEYSIHEEVQQLRQALLLMARPPAAKPPDSQQRSVGPSAEQGT
jgi:hypothetical protein